MPTVPESDLHRIQQWAALQWPDRFKDEVRWEVHARGRNVTLCETRTPWSGHGEWTHQSVAQLRYRPDTADWTLHWADRNSRWHPYDPLGSLMTGDVTELLAEVDRDPTAIFKG